MSAAIPPGPKGSVLLGSLPEARRDPLAFVLRVSAEYGDIVHVRLATFRVYLLNHPDDIEQVLVTHQHRFIKGRSLGRARRLFGNGLLTSDGALHHRQRRIIQPAFQRLRLAPYAGDMVSLAIDCRNRWTPGNVVDMAAEMGRLTLAIAAKTLLGIDIGTLVHEAGETLETATSLLEVAILPLATMVDLLPLPHVRRLRAARAAIDRTLEELITKRRLSRSLSQPRPSDQRSRGTGRGEPAAPKRDSAKAGGAPRQNGEDDLLSMLLDARDENGAMSDVQLRDELTTILLAGHETTANALAWTWYLVARHPEVEQRLHQEIDAVLGERTPTVDDVPALSYTRMVFAEAMRLYPPAWLLGRVAVEDHEARGYRIPAGSLVVLSPWGVHRNETYFPEPERFDPERWHADQIASRPRFSYFPFGGGSRGCMGETFAWMEGVLLVAVLAQRWRFRLADESCVPELQPAITLKAKNGIRMRPELRTQNSELRTQNQELRTQN